MIKTNRVVIVGAGPCGVAAAIQLKRSGAPICVFERDRVGGLLRNANLVENYPGFPDSLSGEALCDLLEKHLLKTGITPIYEEVIEIQPFAQGYQVITNTGFRVNAVAIILASGTRPNTRLFPGEENLSEARLFYEIKDLFRKPLKEGKKTAIVGGGDAAYDYALNLAKRGLQVFIIQRAQARCLPLLKDRVEAHPLISILSPASILDSREESGVIKIELDVEKKLSILQADFLLAACGRSPEDKLLKPLKGLPGVFTGGDLIRGGHRQTGIAIGDGLAAAMAAAEYIDRKWESH